MKLTKYILTTDILNEVGMDNQRIIFSTRTSTSILISEETYELLIHEKWDLVDEEFLKVLIKKEFIVPKTEDEFDYIMKANAAAKEDASTLSMTIQPSANCQLGCHYCGQIHTKHYATDDVIDKYYERIKMLTETNRYNKIGITWYGGEPLTAYSAIKKTSQKLIDLCLDKNLSYSADMITNGLSLKPSLFEDLAVNCKITNYQITIDGSAESHDKRRITKSGEPTFAIIFKNIIDVTNTIAYTDLRCGITIRVNIDETNYQFVDPLIDLIRENKLQRKVSIYFAPIVNFGGNDAGKAGLKNTIFAEKEIDWYLKCFENEISVNDLPTRVHSVCMVEREDSEVFDAFGNIYSCWEFPYSTGYATGDSLIGNLFQPPETYNKNATLRNWTDTLKSGKTWCKNCNHLPICGGSCPKSWHEGTPACPSFKFNYKERLLLDYYMKKSRVEIKPYLD
jgi:uncharacterized protein